MDADIITLRIMQLMTYRSQQDSTSITPKTPELGWELQHAEQKSNTSLTLKASAE
jgi:hypothetical protein